MSKMSQLALEIECALDDGFSYEEIIQGLMNEYEFLTAETAREWIDSAVRGMDEYERRCEIDAEARFV